MIEVQRTGDKAEQYRILTKQVEALLADESNALANMANVCSVIHHSFDHHWTGFYLVEENELVLGPFQGPPACTRISRGKGVCGTAWSSGQTQIVGNVHEFEGHIACSPESNSEIVVPLRDASGEIWGIFDIDSKEFNWFNEDDQTALENILKLLNS